MMNKRGLGVSQAFTFIVLVITFSLVMLFGYKSIAGLLVKGEQIELVQFQKDLENSIKVLYTDFGSVREEQFKLPGKYTQICFVDMDFTGEMDGLEILDAVAFSVWQDSEPGTDFDYDGYNSVDYNVFLQPVGLFKVFRIKIGDDGYGKRGYLCLPIQEGQFSLRLEGRGDHTMLNESKVR